MTRSLTVVMVMFVSLVWLMGASPAAAADSPIGTWVKKSETGKPAMTLTMEEWSPGKAKLTWRVAMSKVVLTLVFGAGRPRRAAVHRRQAFGRDDVSQARRRAPRRSRR